jgi:CRP/FNR family transcriptional regulator, cyclic AMP receptor protein
VAIFRELPESELAGLARQVTRRPHRRGDLIFSTGEPGDGLYIVQEGQVAITRQNPQGDELILGVMEPGEYFGELALFDDEPRSASASSATDGSLLFLSRSAFREFMTRHPEALFSCLAVIVERLRRCTDLADDIALLDIPTRIARRLLRLAREGSVDLGGRTTPPLNFHITQRQLASMVGATRESVNKHLNALQDEQIVWLGRGRIQIRDLARLEARAGPQ